MPNRLRSLMLVASGLLLAAQPLAPSLTHGSLGLHDAVALAKDGSGDGGSNGGGHGGDGGGSGGGGRGGDNGGGRSGGGSDSSGGGRGSDGGGRSSDGGGGHSNDSGGRSGDGGGRNGGSDDRGRGQDDRSASGRDDRGRGRGADDRTEHGARTARVEDRPGVARPGGVSVDGRHLEVTTRDGYRQEIRNGRFEMKDRFGRTVVERRATPDDRTRILEALR